MSTIAAPRPRSHYLPFDEEESLPTRVKVRSSLRTGVAWVALPLLAALAVAATGYIAETAQGTTLTYQIASLQAQKAQLANTSQVLTQELDQADSAGALNAAATHLGMVPPPTWQVLTPAARTVPDPLVPVLLALKGA
ncbi:MAG TPA: hypothetical protein VNF75_00590 [Candidatus Dormibacteraeota bacterium]|nr:hypothetical protein [Candidatus Dormibacteraeota bacterium]HVD02631.1 hypothetical protein [Candidatus Dormibacteraeota bacterium]